MNLESGKTTKSFYNDAYQENHWSEYDVGPERMDPRVHSLREDTSHWLRQVGLSDRVDATVLEVGCGMAYLASVHPGWHGVEYSRSAVERVQKLSSGKLRIIEGDAQELSFSDASFDGVFTWAALEHVPDPNKALIEIDRILKPGGSGFIAPAWNCRSWTVEKLAVRPYSDLTLTEKLAKFLIPIREPVLVRAVQSIPGRIIGEMGLLAHQPMPLRFKALRPRWDLIEKYGHISDDDAVASMDPHAAICFFKSRGYEVISHPTMTKRLSARFGPVVVRKPN